MVKTKIMEEHSLVFGFVVWHMFHYSMAALRKLHGYFLEEESVEDIKDLIFYFTKLFFSMYGSSYFASPH
jgi:hypothetical protein